MVNGICKKIVVEEQLWVSASVYFGGFFNSRIDDTPGKAPTKENIYAYVLDDVLTMIESKNNRLIFAIDTDKLSKSNNPYKGVFMKWANSSIKRGTAVFKDIFGKKYMLLIVNGNRYAKQGSNNFTVGISGDHEWQLIPDEIKIKSVTPLFAQLVKDAKVSKNGFVEGENIMEINFKKVRYLDAPDLGGSPKPNLTPKTIRISENSILHISNTSGQPIENPKLTSARIKRYIEYALFDVNPPSIPRAGQGGGAIIRINDHLDEVPYTFALQKLWEDKLKHYKDIEPEYQQMLPPPEPSPIQELQEPFHRYMDEFGDQDILEEARASIGMMSPADAENLFHDDLPHINSMYERAMPDIDDRLIPIFIRADILRLLTK
jgi:hypothetical protein